MNAAEILLAKGASLFAPSPTAEHALAQLERRSGVRLPADYHEFLDACDGALFDDGVLYGAEAHVHEASRVPVRALAEMNENTGWRRPAVVLGVCAEDLIIFDGVARLFALANRVDLELYESAELLADLLTKIEP